MKKGSSHIDWAISIGIFIVYLLLLFIFVRPGQVKEYQGDLLLSIVEKNFKNEFTGVYWSLLEIPIFVNTTYIDGTHDAFLIDSFPFSTNKFNDGNTIILDSNLASLPLNLEDTTEDRELIFNVTDFGNNKKLIYKVVHSKYIDIKPIDPTYTSVANVSNTTIFGIGEILIGISENKFKELSKDYNKLKADWRYPKLKDFSIRVSDNKEVLLSLNQVTPPEDVNIYVLQWSDFILYNDTTKKLVTVNVRAW